MPVPKGTRIGGRSKGTKNKVTLQKEAGHAEIIAKAEAAGETPLEYMLRVMRTSEDTKRKDAMAIAAAPFVHPKLAAIEHSGNDAKPMSFQIISGVPREDEETVSHGHAHSH
jgi:hypothetical protein